MDEQTKARIFEPFYTTKEAGRGTGLGLSTVYGIVKQNQGYIWVYSEAQKGTTLKVYLPLVSEPADAISVPALTKQSKRGDGQTILLVEDDSAVRELVRHTLENANYKVLEAPTPQAALEFMEGRKGEIQLVLTDIMMPKMSGVQVATSAKASDPNLKVLFMSGYSSEMVNRYAPALQAKEYIEKPFTKDALLRKIADLLLSRGTREKARLSELKITNAWYRWVEIPTLSQRTRERVGRCSSGANRPAISSSSITRGIWRPTECDGNRLIRSQDSPRQHPAYKPPFQRYW